MKRDAGSGFIDGTAASLLPFSSICVTADVQTFPDCTINNLYVNEYSLVFAYR